MSFMTSVFHRHNWVFLYDSENYPSSSKSLSFIFCTKIRVCVGCGKSQYLDRHCLGYNPTEYTETWRDVNLIEAEKIYEGVITLLGRGVNGR